MLNCNLGITPFMGMEGYDDIDMELNNGAYPMFGTGSVFGSGFANMPMMGMGMGAGGYNPQDFYNNMRQQQQLQTEYNIEQQQLNRNADLRVNAPLEAIKGTATALKDKIVNNEQDQIEDAYNRFVEAVAAAYGDCADKNILKARANSLYASMNNGVTIVQDLRQHGHGSATQGFLQALTLGTYNRHSAEDNVSYVTGSPVGTSEKTSHNMGRLAGAATVGGVVAGVAKALKSTKSVKLGLIGAGIAAAMSFLTGKVTT